MRYLALLLVFTSSLSFGLSDKFKMKTQSEVAVSASVLALPFRYERNYLLIQNKGTDSVVIKLGSAHSGTEGVLIPVGGNYEPTRVPLDSIYAKSISGTQTVLFLEGVE